MSPLPADLRAGCRRAQQLGAMLVLTIVIYAYVLSMIAAQQAPFTGFAPSVDMRVLRVLFAILTVADLVVLRIVVRRLLAMPVPARTAWSSVTQRLFTTTVVRLAICETIAIFGVVLFLLGGHWLDFYAFAIASLAAFAVHFPRLSQWEDWARQAPA